MNVNLKKDESKLIFLLNDIIFREIDFEIASKTTIVSLSLSKDKSYLDVYLTFYDTIKTKDLLNYYNKKSSFFRYNLAKNLKTRKVPMIRFFLDDTQEKMKQIDDLLKKVE